MKKIGTAGFLFLDSGRSMIVVFAIIFFALPAFATDFSQSSFRTMKFGVKLYSITNTSPRNSLGISYGHPSGNRAMESGIFSGFDQGLFEVKQPHPLDYGLKKIPGQGFPKKIHQFMGFCLRYLHLDDTSAWVDPKMRINTQEQAAAGDGNIVLEIQAGPADLSGVVLYSLKI